jgi:glutathione reductase (NADPH)
LELDNLPSRILFIGGGYIAFEFAHVAVRVGSQVTIVQRGARPLSQFDPDLVDQIVAKSRELGIDVQLEAQAQGVEKDSEVDLSFTPRRRVSRRHSRQLWLSTPQVGCPKSTT